MDHKRVDIYTSHISCGVAQFARISDEIPETMFAIANSFYHPSRGNPPAFAMFSNVHIKEGTNADRLSDFIQKRDKDFGTVFTSWPAINPHTGNPIKIYVWTINHENLKEWYKQEKIERLKK